MGFEILEISKPDSKKLCNVIFLHGLKLSDDNNPKATWYNEQGEGWPDKIAELFPQAGVFLIDYPSSASYWWGSSMAIENRAPEILERLRLHQISELPMIFVVHSMGGLLIKQCLFTAKTMGEDKWVNFLKNTKSIFFLATPNTGSNLATIFGKIPFLLKTPSLDDLKKYNPHLSTLRAWYLKFAKILGIETHAFFETRPFYKVNIVVEGPDADPCVEGCTAIGVDGDHFTISKPSKETENIFLTIKETIKKNLISLSRSPNQKHSDLAHNPENLLLLDHWERFDSELQEVFSLAYGISAFKCNNEIRTRDFFHSVYILMEEDVSPLLFSQFYDDLPVDNLNSMNSDCLKNGVTISECLSNSIRQLIISTNGLHKISTLDLIFDVIKYGTGTSVSRLGASGISEKKVETIARNKNRDILKRRNINIDYYKVLEIIYNELSKENIKWALTGGFNQTLQGIEAEEYVIDIQTDKDGAFKIENIFSEFIQRKVELSTYEPLNIRSFFGSLQLNGIEVQIMGDIQYRDSAGIWSAPIDVSTFSEYFQYGRWNLPVMSLEHEMLGYERMGQSKKAERIREHLLKKSVSANPKERVLSDLKYQKQIISSIIDDISTQLPRKIINDIPGIIDVFHVGSTKLGFKEAFITRGVIDIDILILFQAIKKIGVSKVIKLIQNEVTLLNTKYSSKLIKFKAVFVNAPYKPESKPGYITIMLHCLIHSKDEFIKNQPQTFKYSWFDSPSTKEDCLLLDILDKPDLSRPPTLAEVCEENEGTHWAINIIENVDHFEVINWENMITEKAPEPELWPLSKFQQKDLIHYLVIWFACNIMRAETKYRWEIAARTFSEFHNRYSNVLGSQTSKLPLTYYHKRETADYDNLSINQLKDEAISFLKIVRKLDYIDKIESLITSDIAILLNFLSHIFEASLTYGIQKAAFELLTPELGYNFDVNHSDHLRNLKKLLLEDPSKSADNLRNFFSRRLYYYIVKICQILELQNPIIQNSFVNRIPEEHVSFIKKLKYSLQDKVYRIPEDKSGIKRIKNKNDLYGMKEHTLDDEIFTLCSILTKKNHFNLEITADLIHTLLRLVSINLAKDTLKDSANMWWAFYHICNNQSVISASHWDSFINLFEAVITNNKIIIPEDDQKEKNISPEIFNEHRTRLYTVLNQAQIIKLSAKEDIPISKEHINRVRDIMFHNINWLFSRTDVTLIYNVALRLEVLSFLKSELFEIPE